jgi:predicted PurR-regulated permease PerM
MSTQELTTPDVARLGTASDPGGGHAPRWLHRAALLALAAVIAFNVAQWGFTHLRSFLGLVFLAWLFAISIEPVVDALERRGVRRGLATGGVMLAAVVSLLGFVVVFGSLLLEQLTQLVESTPAAVDDVVAWANATFGTDLSAAELNNQMQLSPEQVQNVVEELTSGVLGLVSSLVGLLFQGFTLLLFAYYMSAEGPALRGAVASWFPPQKQRVVRVVWEIAVDKTGGYVVSRLVLAGFSALFTGVFLWAIGVPSWLPLAIWTGVVSQFIPTLGTYLAIALPAMVALLEDPVDALWVVVFATVYQQVENYVIAPRITARTVDIHPAVAFGAVIVGAALFGPVGALVSIPVVAAAQALVESYGHRYALVVEEGASRA